MLILKFIEPEKSKFSFLRKNKKIFKTSGFICSNTVFNVIELYKKDLKNPDVLTLLNRYKGFVLDTQDGKINELLSSYLFDYTPYIKRALLSSLYRYLKSEEGSSLYVCDDDFRFSSEWLDIAGCCRKIVVSGIENNDMRIFRSYCYNEFGLNVFINDESFLDKRFLTIDMNNLKSQCAIEICGNNKRIIYPDSMYFNCNESAEKLVSLGVSRQSACAAVQVVPFKKIYVTTE